ncbi:ABC transporter permease [Clostridium sp. YIM B02515]|uniref:ABC transporter permease n=1 Tax=Clostridium rhizosphaerae TaxID=2803861 RepID=A0ABS1T960_9CLOT|nr:ABC transporter permease [Clostridium rhizosphaerae]MBL4935878.1 ABC transporter permease [Clostridium rhizosphaerae]
MEGIKSFFRVIYKNKQAFAGLIMLIAFIIMAVAGVFVKVDMTVQFDQRYQPPSIQHILGTDYAGRDTFLQLVKGSTDVLTIGIYAGFMTLIIGFIIGATAGLAGGWIDIILTFFTDLFLTVPTFPLMMILATTVKINNNIIFALILSVFSWAALARSIRAQILSLKEREFIVVCKAMGLKTPYIVFKEIMPNITSYLAINFVMIIQSAIVSSVGLMLLGLSPYTPTNWGMMLNLAIKNTGGIFNPKGYYYLLSPMLCIALFQMSCIFFSSGLDEALNPRLRS